MKLEPNFQLDNINCHTLHNCNALTGMVLNTYKDPTWEIYINFIIQDGKTETQI